MKMKLFIFAFIGLFVLNVSTSLAESKVLWIAVKQDHKLSAEIAMPVGVVKAILEASSDTSKISLSGLKLSAKTFKKALKQTHGEILTVTNYKDATETKLSIRKFKMPPDAVKGGKTLVVDVYKDGEKSTTVKVPNYVLKTLLFLFGGAHVAGNNVGMQVIDAISQSGGFVYIKDYQDHSVTWIYEK
ncbi:MAG TPA: hypothetical protein ENG82_05525 [Bacteroidetes bacterium]|nr:hypothetical protein BMS3Bbin03_02585 [bacterium BMS3Bbin03]HDK36349.1 hypothetical protein [Bacteroidota bacterium]HDZ11783.1 hypothetical protein [Bacteroidota bacterium]